MQCEVVLDLQISTWVKSFCLFQYLWVPWAIKNTKQPAAYTGLECFYRTPISNRLGFCSDDNTSPLLPEPEANLRSECKIWNSDKRNFSRKNYKLDCTAWNSWSYDSSRCDFFTCSKHNWMVLSVV